MIRDFHAAVSDPVSHRRPDFPSLTEKLSERENQVLQLLIGGFSIREIAMRLNISVRTVEIYRILIDQKLDQADSAFSFAPAVRADRPPILA